MSVSDRMRRSEASRARKWTSMYAPLPTAGSVGPRAGAFGLPCALCRKLERDPRGPAGSSLEELVAEEDTGDLGLP